MRIAIIGQQAFGKAVLEAFLGRGDDVAGVFVAPDAPQDPLRVAATERRLPVFPVERYGAPEAIAAIRGLGVELGIMAYVTQFVPQSFRAVPRHGIIQFHPSLLPQHRGPSAINWAIIHGRRRTGLSIFRPVDGLDEGPLVLQKAVEIGPDDTVGSVYFERIFPQGVAALLEAADLVVSGRAREWTQDESEASYEGWVREAESRINWANPVNFVYDLIRGCNPAPGAWTTWGGRQLQIFDARKHVARTFGEVRNVAIGEVVDVTPAGFKVHAQGGFIDVLRCRVGDGKKLPAGELGITAGTILGG